MERGPQAIHLDEKCGRNTRITPQTSGANQRSGTLGQVAMNIWQEEHRVIGRGQYSKLTPCWHLRQRARAPGPDLVRPPRLLCRPNTRAWSGAACDLSPVRLNIRRIVGSSGAPLWSPIGTASRLRDPGPLQGRCGVGLLVREFWRVNGQGGLGEPGDDRQDIGEVPVWAGERVEGFKAGQRVEHLHRLPGCGSGACGQAAG